MTKILFIDNFDSFTFNLVDEFEKRDCEVLVYRNNISFQMINQIIVSGINLIIISPGGFIPKEVPLCKKIIRAYCKKIPIFGICLGHQCIIEAFEGKIGRTAKPIHGKSSKILHDNKTIFENIENPFGAGRYHSQTGIKIPECLEISAKTPDGIVMGVRHKKYFVEGVQFHPESVLTPLGGKMIENLISKVKMNEKNLS
ncbi:aminodeoxychorismate/anthranilate synthase component II [Candidatus Woesearchaeota archaeon]|nr:aminodeoxychorismate/anthranilate synthase component II [Candidatus Woesearchaeota archaeon]